MKELPSVLELENLLANQESLVKQVAGLQIKQEEEAFFAGRGKSQSNPNSKRQEKSSQNGESSEKKDQIQKKSKRRGCYRCGKTGHFIKDCKAKLADSKAATTTSQGEVHHVF